MPLAPKITYQKHADTLPEFMQIGRPLWVALFLTYWVLALPHRVAASVPRAAGARISD